MQTGRLKSLMRLWVGHQYVKFVAALASTLQKKKSISHLPTIKSNIGMPNIVDMAALGYLK